MTPSESGGEAPSTSWSLLWKAHHGSSEDRAKALDLLLQRYQGFVVAVLSKALGGDPRAPYLIAECCQECWRRLVEGKFKNLKPVEMAAGAPRRAAFRPYLFRVLMNLVNDHGRALSRAMDGLAGLDPAAEVESPVDRLIDEERREVYRAALASYRAESTGESVSDEVEKDYLGLYRQHLLAAVMEELKRQDEKTGRHFYAVLKAKLEDGETTAADLARRLSQGGKERTEVWVRVELHRARLQVGKMIRERVVEDLWSPADGGADGHPRPTLQEVDEELEVLGLLKYCPSAD